MQPTHHITSGRAELAVYAVGAGAPVVFLHANVCDSRMWRVQLDAIGAKHQAIAYDRRGFGATRAKKEDFSSVADLMAVVRSVSNGEPAILIGCSQGGKIALDAALLHPSEVRALGLVAPGIGGAPAPNYPPEIEALLALQSKAEARGDLEALNAIKAHLWLDGPLAAEGRVGGEARQLFLDMNGIALRSLPTGGNSDAPPVFDRLREIAVPTLILWGDLDFPHIQERCRHLVATMPRASGHELTGVAHLPSMECSEAVTRLLGDFVEHVALEAAS